MVWLLVLLCLWAWVPVSAETTTPTDVIAAIVFGDDVPVGGVDASPAPGVAFVLSILLIVVFWGFSYFASRILSRIVKRLDGLFIKKPTITSVYKTKLGVHAVGILALAVLLSVTPFSYLTQSAIILLGLFSGVAGTAAVPLQHHVAKRHKVPFDHYL